jgi:hypothetical protein
MCLSQDYFCIQYYLHEKKQGEKRKLARQALSHTPHNPNHPTHSANELELITQPCHGLSAGL